MKKAPPVYGGAFFIGSRTRQTSTSGAPSAGPSHGWTAKTSRVSTSTTPTPHMQDGPSTGMSRFSPAYGQSPTVSSICSKPPIAAFGAGNVIVSMRSGSPPGLKAKDGAEGNSRGRCVPGSLGTLKYPSPSEGWPSVSSGCSCAATSPDRGLVGARGCSTVTFERPGLNVASGRVLQTGRDQSVPRT